MRFFTSIGFAAFSITFLVGAAAFGQGDGATVPPPAESESLDDSPFSDPASKLRVSQEKYDYWKTLYQRANAELKQGDDQNAAYGRAIDASQKALTYSEKNFGAEHPLTAESLLNIAAIYERQDRPDKAAPLIRRAMEIDKKAFGTSSLVVAKHLLRFADIYASVGKFDKAESLYKRALEIQERRLGAEDARLLETLHSLGSMYQTQRKFTQADKLFARAAEIAEKAYGDANPKLVPPLNWQAASFVAQEQYELAEPILLRAEKILDDKGVNAVDPAFFDTISSLEQVREAQEKYEEAEELQKRIIAIDEKRSLNESAPLTAGFEYQRLARLYDKQGKYAEAADTWKRVLVMYEKSIGENSPIRAHALRELAKTYRKLNKLVEAGECEEMASRILSKTP